MKIRPNMVFGRGIVSLLGKLILANFSSLDEHISIVILVALRHILFYMLMMACQFC